MILRGRSILIARLHTRIPRLSVDLFSLLTGCFRPGPAQLWSCTYDRVPGSCCTGRRPDGCSAPTRQRANGPTPLAWDRCGEIRAGLIRNASARLSIDHHRSQHRLTLPRCRSSTISSNIPSTPPLFCCRNRRHFMHRPPKLLFGGKLKQPVCRLTLPTIVRF